MPRVVRTFTNYHPSSKTASGSAFRSSSLPSLAPRAARDLRMNIIRAAVYARVSTKPQAGEDKISIADQLRECRAALNREGWTFAGEFVDPGFSANIIERPGLKSLLGSVDQFDVVVAWDFDRYYRERRSVAGYILDTLDEHRKQITSVKQPIPIYDPALYDPRENDTPYVLREMAGFTSGIDNRRRFRTLQKGLKERFAQGYMMHPPAFGYGVNVTVQDGKVIKLPRRVVPKQARTVRRIFHEYLSGKSYRDIAAGLNMETIPSPRGLQWSNNTINCIIRNPIYCGKVYRARVKVHGRLQRLPDDQWVVLPGKHRPIVSEQIWQQAQAVRKRKRPQARAIGSPALLSGLLRCGYCGSPMCKHGGSGSTYYGCARHKQTKGCRPNGYRMPKLEAEVLAHVFDIMRSEDIYGHVRNQQRQEHVAELQSDVQRLEHTIAEFTQRKERLLDLYESGRITKEEFTERCDVHKQRRDNLEHELREKRATLARAESVKLDQEMFLRVLQSLEQEWKQLDMMERKRKLAALVEKIVITNGAFKIHFRVDV